MEEPILMCLARLKALLRITSEHLDEKEDDDFVSYHLKFIAETMISSSENGKYSSDIWELGLKCLTNLCSNAGRNELLFNSFSSNELRVKFMSALENKLYTPWAQDIDNLSLLINALQNITCDSIWVDHLFLTSASEFLKLAFASEESMQRFLPLLLNMTAQKAFRNQLCWLGSARNKLADVLLSQNTPVDTAIMVAGILKNCCFEDDLHNELLASHCRLLDAFLVHLCGPEDEIDDEDRSLLPRKVRSLPGTPTSRRSESTLLLSTVCEALLQLCATSDSRKFLRSHGVYFILRELHKHVIRRLSSFPIDGMREQRQSLNRLSFDIEQVVDQLICEEHERDPSTLRDSLRAIEVDASTAEKLDRARNDYINDFVS